MSQCDFEYLVRFLRGQGKLAIGFSRAGHIAWELPPVLTEYFDIANLRTLIKIFESSGIEPTLFKTVDTTNTALLEKQGLLETLKNNWLQNKGA